MRPQGGREKLDWCGPTARAPRASAAREGVTMSSISTPSIAPATVLSTRFARRVTGFVVVSLAVTLAGCTVPAVPEPGATASSTAAPTVSPTDVSSITVPAEPVWVTAYFMVDTRLGLRLARERQSLPDDGVATAVGAMIAGAKDPDYSTPWNPQTEVLSVTQDDDLITVDLSQDALTANVGSEGAALMIQQLVWTVTGAAGQPDTAVALLIEGAAPNDLWGAVRWDDPVVRVDPLDVRLSMQLDVPAEGEVFPAGTVTISGEAAAYEANVPWLITAGGAEVISGFTMTSAGQQFAPFEFAVELQPGEYVVEINEGDPSGGEGGGPMIVDTRTFTVAQVGLPSSGGV